MTETKPKALKCSDCGGRAEPWLRPEVKSRGVVIFPSKWVQVLKCGKCEALQMARQEADNEQRLSKERLFKAGLGEPGLARLEFKNYKTDHPARERVAAMVRPVYTDMARTGKIQNIVLSGGAGTGKTHLAVAFAKAALGRGFSVLFRQWPELMLELRDASLSNRHLKELTLLTAYDVLVIDDLGAEKVSDFVVENLFMICDRWWRASKSGLILTTNLPIHEIGRIYGDRVSSRLGGLATLIDFEGCPDGRIETLRLEER